MQNPSDRLEELSLESGLQEGMGAWFQYAPMLIRTSSTTNTNYQYVMKIESKLFKDVLNGLPTGNIIGSQVRAGYGTNSSNIALLPLSVASSLLSPLSILNLIKFISNLLITVAPAG